MSDGPSIGKRIRQRREELNLSLSALAEKAGVAKSYLSNLESDQGNARPSGQTLYRIAEALGTTISDLLGTRLLVEPPTGVPPSLAEFAREAELSDRDVAMLAGINFRGQQPQTTEAWAFVWRAIKASIEPERRHR
jgi:transcriptional regulator with XRE-family HTH domain